MEKKKHVLDLVVNLIVTIFAIVVIAQETTKPDWVGLGTACALVLLALRNIARALADKHRENARVAEILSHTLEWGEEICRILVERRYSVNNIVIKILSHVNDWGEDTVKLVLMGTVSIGMNEEMVRLAWGEPSSIDRPDKAEGGKTVRWSYGVMQRQAKHILFEDGKVVAIKK